MSDARAAILTRIRHELGRPAADSAQIEDAATEQAYSDLPRTYRMQGQLPPASCVSLLLDRLIDYDTEVLACGDADLAEAVAAVLARHGESILLIPDDLPASWLPDSVELLRDAPDAGALPLATLTRAPAVLTACAGAIAETGTILMNHHQARQGRRVLTLLPDHHLCILRRDQVVETVSEGLGLVADTPSNPMTTISGPSATADIEMTRIRGVHGPRRLTVFLIP